MSSVYYMKEYILFYATFVSLVNLSYYHRAGMFIANRLVVEFLKTHTQRNKLGLTCGSVHDFYCSNIEQMGLWVHIVYLLMVYE